MLILLSEVCPDINYYHLPVEYSAVHSSEWSDFIDLALDSGRRIGLFEQFLMRGDTPWRMKIFGIGVGVGIGIKIGIRARSR
jgi:hypothetical protein